MSEYQYYEFQAIDRPLDEEEMAAVDKLSSRVNLSPNHASFVYHYSNLPTNAEKLLEKYFDAMFYIANWGSCQLMFRFPENAVDFEQMQTYCRPYIVEDFVSVTKSGDYVLLNIRLYNEEPEWGWVEGEGWLPRLMSLREDIIRGDYRLLYLAWLMAITLEEEILDDTEEPLVPPELNNLSPGLRAFVDLFELDTSLIGAAAQASDSPRDVDPTQLRRIIEQLSSETQVSWLLRLAQGEPQLAAAFQRELARITGQPRSTTVSRRTVGDLLAIAETVEEVERAKQAAVANAKHLKKMEDLASQEVEVWQNVFDLIDRKTGRAYDEAVVQLKNLSELAEYQQKEAQFREQLNKIYLEYRSRSALLRRLREGGLYEQ